jgi:16S rRNA (guanine527-N7)-methyltransferase
VTEHEAQELLRATFSVSRETEEKLIAFADFLRSEAYTQNLISASTIDSIWSRHILDSAQLLRFVPSGDHRWVDLGSGAGFPGIVISLLRDCPVTLVESRGRRIDYLERAVALLGLGDRVTIEGKPLERMETAPFSVISARAFAPLPRLFHLAARFSTDKTLWLLPKGRNAAKEWSEVQADWSGDFRIEPSVTDVEAGILVGYLVGRRNRRTDSVATRRNKR